MTDAGRSAGRWTWLAVAALAVVIVAGTVAVVRSGSSTASPLRPFCVAVHRYEEAVMRALAPVVVVPLPAPVEKATTNVRQRFEALPADDRAIAQPYYLALLQARAGARLWTVGMRRSRPGLAARCRSGGARLGEVPDVRAPAGVRTEAVGGASATLRVGPVRAKRGDIVVISARAEIPAYDMVTVNIRVDGEGLDSIVSDADGCSPAPPVPAQPWVAEEELLWRAISPGLHRVGVHVKAYGCRPGDATLEVTVTVE